MSKLRWLPVVLLLLAPTAAGAQSWRLHSYPEDGFEVQFSGFVNIKPMELKRDAGEGIARGAQYLQESGTALYLVGASLNKYALAFDAGVEKSFEGLGCKRRTGDRQVDAPWGRGRELRGTDCVDGKYRAEAIYHRSGLWFYQVLALYREDTGDAASARYFLDSFKVIQ